MHPRFSNFAMVVMVMGAVSIVEKITSAVKVTVRGYPSPRPVHAYTRYTPDGDVEETPET